MKILVIGKGSENVISKIKSLREMKHKVDFLKTNKIFPFHKFVNKLFYIFKLSILDFFIENFYKKKISKYYDLIFIYNSPYINKKSIYYLKKLSKKIIFYCADNPFKKRDKNMWQSFLATKNLYSLIVFQQPKRAYYAEKNNIKNYIIVPPSVNTDFFNNSSKVSNYKFDISFVGTWFPERGKFFYDLHKKGLKFKIFGNRWNKDKIFYKFIKKKIELGHLNFKRYKKIISQTKINVCLFSKGNDDDITERCTEITSSGGLLFCEDSKTMKKMYQKNKDVIFFKTVDEFYDLYKKYHKNNRLIKWISNNGRNKTLSLNLDEKKVLKKIIDLTFNLKNSNKKIYFNF